MRARLADYVSGVWVAACCDHYKGLCMLLTIDVGNTNTVLGVFRGEELIANWRLTTARQQTIDEYGVLTRNLFTMAGLDRDVDQRRDYQFRCAAGELDAGGDVADLFWAEGAVCGSWRENGDGGVGG